MKICGFLFLLVGSILWQTGERKEPVNTALTPSIGLEIGQQAPKFALLDQFGQQQSNETLKGPKGTVILFFRSADW